MGKSALVTNALADTMVSQHWWLMNPIWKILYV
jgi:hypothetical protein